MGTALGSGAHSAGMTVFGYDRDPSRCIDFEMEHGACVEESAWAVSESPDALADCRSILICVETPIYAGKPDLGPLGDALRTVSDHLQPGQLVVIESTVVPGTSRHTVLPELTRGTRRVGRDFHLAYSPERMSPGMEQMTMRNIPKLVGGITPECRGRAIALYKRFVDDIVEVDTVEVAEAAKIFENSYRAVNIALVNEFAKMCHAAGIDVWDTLLAASTKPFGFQAFSPGPGVGGACIPKDLEYLSYFSLGATGSESHLLVAAAAVNGDMPRYVSDRIHDSLIEQGAPNGRVLLLGMTYKANVPDFRGSPGLTIASLLKAEGASVEWHDPYDAAGVINIEGRIDSISEELLGSYDVVVLVQPHTDYDLEKIVTNARCVFDANGVLSSAHKVIRL